MMRHRLAGLVGLLLLVPFSAGAEPLGQAGQVTLGAERVFGLQYAKQENRSEGYTSFSVFGATGVEALTTPYGIPRLGLDYFAAERFSIGVSGTFARLSRGSSSNATHIFSFNPRVGIAIPLGESATFWPRFGMNYVSLGDDRDSEHILAVSLEAQFVFRLAGSVGLSLTPTADIGVEASGSRKMNQFGASGGLVGWF